MSTSRSVAPSGRLPFGMRDHFRRGVRRPEPGDFEQRSRATLRKSLSVRSSTPRTRAPVGNRPRHGCPGYLRRSSFAAARGLRRDDPTEAARGPADNVGAVSVARASVPVRARVLRWDHAVLVRVAHLASRAAFRAAALLEEVAAELLGWVGAEREVAGGPAADRAALFARSAARVRARKAGPGESARVGRVAAGSVAEGSGAAHVSRLLTVEPRLTAAGSAQLVAWSAADGRRSGGCAGFTLPAAGVAADGDPRIAAQAPRRIGASALAARTAARRRVRRTAGALIAGGDSRLAAIVAADDLRGWATVTTRRALFVRITAVSSSARRRAAVCSGPVTARPADIVAGRAPSHPRSDARAVSEESQYAPSRDEAIAG